MAKFLLLFVLITISVVVGVVFRSINRSIWLRPIERELGQTPADDELHIPSYVKSGWEM